MRYAARLRKLEEGPWPEDRREYSQYVTDPCLYASEILGVEWTQTQREIARLLTVPPYRVLCKAAHEVGKTYLAAGLVSWWYDVHDPGLVLTTAPTDRQVRDLLWKEIRVQRSRAGLGGFRGPKMPRLESSPDHFAHGFTTNEPEAFQGHHSPHILIVFDEAVGVDACFWESAESMFGGQGHAWLCIFNPTDQSSQAYIEERTGGWHVVTLDSINHPNIAAELSGQPPPYPSAVRLARLDERLRKWSTPLELGEEPEPGDLEWPPESGQWVRPGPVAEARLLGRWPSQAVNAVWSEAIWAKAESLILPEPTHLPPEIGCDVARFGDDFTTMHVRWGGISLYHEAHNGWSTSQTTGRLKTLCGEWGTKHRCDPRRILVKVDDDGVGGGVIDQRGDYCFVPVSAARAACDPDNYPNLRSELWFTLPELVRRGMVTFARLSAEVRAELRRQALSPTYQLDAQGRRVVEPKADTKERLKRSPDDMDAVNLAYFTVQVVQPGPTRLRS